MLTFPTITNLSKLRWLHAHRLRMMAMLKRQAGVKDRQLRKLNLTHLVAQWKGPGLPPPILTDRLAPSYQMLCLAARTLEPADILNAYRSCADFIGATLEES